MFWKRFAAVLTLALAEFDLHAGSCAHTVKSNPDFTGGYILLRMPEHLTYDELVELGTVDAVRHPLKAKLDTVLTKPFVSNQA